MYNRKLDIKKDFHALNEMENKILPLINEIEDEQKREVVKTYIRDTFFKQFKK